MNGAGNLRGLRDVRLLAALGVSATGLVVAMAASGTSEQPAGVGSVAKHLIIDIPEWLKLAVLLALGVATLLVLGLLVHMPHRRRKDEEGYEHVDEPPELTVRDYVFLALLALVPLALAGGMLWLSHWLSASGELGSPGPGLTTPNGEVAQSPIHSPEAVLVHVPGISAVLGTLAILIAAGILGFMLWLYCGDWLSRRSAEPLRPILAGLDHAIADSLDDILLEPDPRRAIIKCYARFEAVLAAAHLARPSWQTPMEFMRSVLQRCPLPHLAVWELTRLFEVARFSEHPLDIREREIAVHSLGSINQALRVQEARHAPNT